MLELYRAVAVLDIQREITVQGVRDTMVAYQTEVYFLEVLIPHTHTHRAKKARAVGLWWAAAVVAGFRLGVLAQVWMVGATDREAMALLEVAAHQAMLS
jgi:hypothetical protein